MLLLLLIIHCAASGINLNSEIKAMDSALTGPDLPARVIIPGNMEQSWQLLSDGEKLKSLHNVDWWFLTDYKKFWDMKSTLGIDKSWSKQKLDYEIIHDLPGIRAKMFQMQNRWDFRFDGILYADADPAKMMWVNLLPAEKRNEAEQKLFSFFKYEDLEGGSRRFLPFQTFNEAAKTDILKAAMTPSLRNMLRVPVDSPLELKKWGQLPEILKFLSFRRFFRLESRPLTLELFNAMMVRDLPTMRATLKPTLDLFNLEHEAEYPELLFWVQHIPLVHRTNAEQQFLQNHPRGYFDGAPSIYAREAVNRREDAKIMRWLADIPVETSARVD